MSTTTVGTAAIEMVVDSAGVESGLSRADTAITRTGRSLATLGTQGAAALDGVGAGAGGAATRVDSATRGMISSIQRTTATMEAGSRSSREYYEALASQRGIDVNALRPYLDQLEAVTARQRAANAAMESANPTLARLGVSADQTAAALQNVPAQLTDIITSLQGGQNPLTVFLQQGGQLRDMFGSTGEAARALGGYIRSLITPYTVAAAGAAALALAYSEGAKEAHAYKNALILTGNAAGGTASQLIEVARAIGEISGSQREASGAVAALAGTGQVSMENLRGAALAAIESQRVFGKSVEDTVSEFEELGRSPAAALDKLNEKYHFITAATYEQVTALERQGKASEAAALAQSAYADGLAGQSDKVLKTLTDWEKGWLGIKKITSSIVDDVINMAMGREKSDSQKITGLLADREVLEDRLTKAVERGNSASEKAIRLALDRNKEQINALRASEDAGKAAAKAEAEAASRDELRIKWSKEYNQQLSAKKRLQEELKAAETQGRDNGLSQEEIEDRKAVIRKKYASVVNDTIEKQIAAIKRQGEVEEEVARRSAAAMEATWALGLARGLDAQLSYADEKEAIDQGALSRQKVRLQEELALTAKQINSDKEQAELRAQIYLIDEKALSRKAKLKQEIIALDVADTRRAANNVADAYDKQAGVRDNLREQVKAQTEFNAQIGLSREAIADLAAVKLEDAASDAERRVAGIASTVETEGMIALYRQQAAELRNLAKLKREGAAKETAAEGLRDLNSFLDPTKAQSFGDALRGAFGSAGDSIVKMTGALENFGQRQAEINKQRGNAANGYLNGILKEKDYLRDMAAISAKDTQSRLAGYGDMAGAAAAFFNEQSTGYQALSAISKVFHAAELAATLAELVPKGISAVLNQGTGDPYTAFGRMAAMAAIVAGLGVAIGGIGGGSGGGVSAADMQKKQGSGAVFGDKTAQSASIQNTLEMLEENSDALIPINKDMLAALRSIELSMKGLANLVVRTPGVIDGSNLGIKEGTIASSGSTVDRLIGGTAGSIIGMAFGPLGSIIGGAIGDVVSRLWGNTKQTIIDSGLQFGGSVRDLQAGIGFSQYASVDTTKSSFFGLSKKTSNSIKTQELDDDLATQFGLVFTGVEKALDVAAITLGVGADHVTEVLTGMSLDLTKVSLKGLTGTELTDAIGTVISKATDDMASAVFPKLDAFRKLGEGYAETVFRLASDYQRLDAVLSLLGEDFGAVGVESLGARERLIDMAGGIDAFTGNMSSFADNFLTEAERLAPAQKYITEQLAAMGLASVDTRDKFKAAIVGMAESGALATKTGAEKFTDLLSLEGSFNTVMEAQERQTKDKRELEIELLEAQGKALEATALRREEELAALKATSPELVGMKQAIYDVSDALDFASKKRTLEITVRQASGDTVGAQSMQRDDELAALTAISPVLAAIQQSAYDAADALAFTTKQRALEIAIMQASGNTAGAVAAQRQDELAALAKTHPALVAQQRAAYAAADGQTYLTKKRELDIELMQASGNVLGAVAAQRKIELEGLAAISYSLAEQKRAAYAAADATKLAADKRALEIAMMEAQGDAAGATAARREDEVEALLKTQPLLVEMKLALLAAQDAVAETTAKRGIEVAIMQAIGDATGVLAAQRADELATLTRTTPALVGLKKTLYAIEDAAKRTDGAFAVLRKSIDAQKSTLRAGLDAQLAILTAQKSAALASLAAQKTVAQKMADDASKENSRLRSLDSGLQSALDSMRLSANAATDRISAQLEISQALATARASGKLPDAEALADSLRAATVQDTSQFSSYADFARDFGVTAGQIADLSAIAGVQIGVSDKAVDLAQQQVDALTHAAESAESFYSAQADAAQAAYDQQVAQLDAQAEAAQEQLDAVRGTTVAVKSVENALRDFKTSIDALAKVSVAAALPPAAPSSPAPSVNATPASSLEYYKGLVRSSPSYSAAGEAAGVYDSIFATYAKSIGANLAAANGLVNQVQVLGDKLTTALAPIATATAATATASGQFATQFDQVSAGGNILLIETE